MSDGSSAIDEIVRLEWELFQAVNEGGPRAACQDDEDTFRAMRRAQFAAWPEEVRRSYLGDLEDAAFSRRNPVREKYIHMMQTTAPAAYAPLAAGVPPVSASARALADDIAAALLEETAALRRAYPYLSGASRPLYSPEDTRDDTSFETYQRGELLTYSERTLELLRAYIGRRAKSGGSLARDILENTVKYYGYGTLEQAEAAAKARADTAGFPARPGRDGGIG